MPELFIIAGPNDAGKTTASFTILPHIFNCREFVNADEIARGLSPFNPESVAFEAGRIMLQRIEQLIVTGQTFAIETTLSTKSYAGLINRCKQRGYIQSDFSLAQLSVAGYQAGTNKSRKGRTQYS